jgi:hypothetical protein
LRREIRKPAVPADIAMTAITRLDGSGTEIGLKLNLLARTQSLVVE